MARGFRRSSSQQNRAAKSILLPARNVSAKAEQISRSKAVRQASRLIDPHFPHTRARSLPDSGLERTWPVGSGTSLFDPNVWSGRALQEDFVELAAAVLHQCIRPLIGACCAPGHHGYQRACVLINGQASTGPSGSPVFARARKTDPPSRLILSQTSAGNC